LYIGGGKIGRYENYPVHVSIDDVDFCMRDLKMNSMVYNSIFEQPFFGFLKIMNKRYGVKFTLYIYAEAEKYSINTFPIKYKKDFKKNSNWLKFGFHSIRPVFSKSETSKIDSFKTAYITVMKNIERFAGKDSKSICLRLHYFYATKDEIEFLSEQGCRILLTADDVKRQSYSLSNTAMKELEHGSYSDQNMHYLATDMRIETFGISPMWELLKHQEDKDTLVVFTHEWALNKRIIKCKFERTLSILANSKAYFIN